MPRGQHADEALLMKRRARSTGTVVALVYNAANDPDQPWETICEEHGGVVCHDTRTLATQWLSHPEEWCEDCMYGPGTLDGTREIGGQT